VTDGTTSPPGGEASHASDAQLPADRLRQADRLLAFGLLDRAEAIYGDVARSQPRNSHALLGLARVSLERGDDHAAHRLASDVLGMDPGDDEARRLEARLAEVLAVRGEPVERPPAAPAREDPLRDRHVPPDQARTTLLGRILRRR